MCYEIYKSSHIYTVTGGMTNGVLAVEGSRIAYVGPEEALPARIRDQSIIHDYGDALIMPGFCDGHTHMMPYAPKADLSKAESISDCVSIIRAFRAAHPDETTVLGEKWYAANWDGTLPGRKDIDEVIADVPFMASDLDCHLAWVNSKMLDKMGLTKETIHVLTGGKPEMVDVDEHGEPTGVLRDSLAMDVIMAAVPSVSTDSVRKMFDVWTKYGVTSVNDMDFYTADSEVFLKTKEMEETGTLNVRVFASLDAVRASIESIHKAQSYMNSDMLHLNALKIFMDGTGAGYTAFMKQNYKDKDTRGNDYISEDDVCTAIRLADAFGLAMHLHCCGDAAVDKALTCYEKMQAAGIKMDPRFSLEHMDTTAEEDVSRPAALGISLNLTPDFLAPTLHWSDNPYLKVYDESIHHELWRLRSFLDTGVNVSFGTDYTASSMNPMDQLYRAVARCADDGSPIGGYHPEEAVTLEEAVYCYTMGSAVSMGMADKIGSLEAGKYADFIVLDQNIFEIDINMLQQTTVRETFLNGKQIFRKEG